MSTAVVVATIVNTNMSEAGFRQHVVEQLRVNERSLLDRLADADGDANVVTAVLNVDEFLAYLIRRFPKAVDAAISSEDVLEQAAQADHTATVETGKLDASKVDTAKMSEGEFMDYMLQQLDSGQIEPTVRFSDKDWNGDLNGDLNEEWDDDGDIGEDFARHPFYY